mmetsp:Transcript_27520/g.37994  ORF Transcript_27520/g.37994 Transcript_27520/m.37994 type:complete len:80 (-) Transcript_27520:639-878(-)
MRLWPAMLVLLPAREGLPGVVAAALVVAVVEEEEAGPEEEGPREHRTTLNLTKVGSITGVWRTGRSSTTLRRWLREGGR